MDEPTNDLDVETLELLESLLMDYQGTLLLVSHDREFLDNVVTSSIAFEGNGKLLEYVGGYTDWLHQGGKWPDGAEQARAEAEAPKKEAASPKPAASKPAAPKPAAKKLSYKLQLELDKLPAELEELEEKVEALQTQVGDPSFYTKDPAESAKTLEELAELEAFLQARYARWEELEAMKE